MAERPTGVRQSFKQRQVAPVPLCVAASLVYFHLHRKISAPNVAALDRALNDAALALAQIADVYYEHQAGRILRIPDQDLRSGLFSDGAKTFKSTAGREFKRLSMRRIDVMHAIGVLEKGSQAVAVASRHDGEHDALAGGMTRARLARLGALGRPRLRTADSARRFDRSGKGPPSRMSPIPGGYPLP